MTPFTAQTPNYPTEIQELLVAIAEAKSERARTAMQKEYYLWLEENSAAKRNEAEHRARMLASGATPEEITELLTDQAGAAQKLASYVGGVAHSIQIRRDLPPYWMVTVAFGEKASTVGASETVRAMLQTNKPTADKWLASIVGAEWVPPTQSLLEVFFEE